MCLWNSPARDIHSEKKKWPSRIDMTVNEANIINKSLIPKDKILFSSTLHQTGVNKAVCDGTTN